MAILCNMLWGSAFPFIKLGYRLFAMRFQRYSVHSLLCRYPLYAERRPCVGVRCGADRKAACPCPRARSLFTCCALGLWQTAAQYFFYYSAVALLTGAMGGILNSTHSFMGVILAHFLYTV